MKGDLLSALWRDPGTAPTVASPRDWEALLGQARRARLSGRLARHFSDHGWLPLVPERPRRALQGALRLVDRQRHEVRWEAACLLRALRQAGTPLVLLKGAAYCVANLPASEGRLFGDIDILVPRDRLGDVENALFAAGWISAERDAYNQRYYREWMHEIPPLRHVQRGTSVDVHHTITPPTSRFKVDGDALWKAVVPVGGEPGVFVLAPADMVLHSAVHLFQEGEFDHGLRDLLDLDDLLRHFSELAPGFWKALFDRAEELRLGGPLSLALEHVEERFGPRVPAAFLTRRGAIRLRGLRGGVLRALLRRALNPHHPTSDERFSETARFLLYVRSHLLRMPLRLALPHLLRKAWMRRFSEHEAPPGAGAMRGDALPAKAADLRGG